jgi:type I restriction enzyme, R subunit
VGLDRDAATNALSGFLDGRTLTADQHDLIALIVEHLTANGAMEIGRLYEVPFTSVAAGGPESLFAAADVEALVEAIRAVAANAKPREARRSGWPPETCAFLSERGAEAR